ncbi:MAG: prepilin-type N-terminal cleavage/methylation domain-containing protein, partial [Candidatus Omnitrophica bacterium]|nr:prepilin-type N-terminal cleavage/methylation domain-containing protein [Candidatus Omnitrophota bacterium]
MQKLKDGSMISRGFTLVESMISMALIIIISGIVFLTFNTANTVGFINTDFIYLQQQTRQALDGMSREIRQNRVADGVNINNGCSRIDFAVGGNVISYYLNAGSQIIRESPVG